jgi:POT family proton-dependent oligopeptide transporter
VILGIVWKKVALLDIYKYILGMFILVFMFVAVALGIYMSGIHSENLVGGYWVVLCYTCLGVAELFVAAIGLSLATRLAPEGQIGGYMGLWLVNLGIGGFVAGIIANYAAIPKGVTGIIELKHIYLHSFIIYIGIAIVAFIFTIFACLRIKKLLGDEA